MLTERPQGEPHLEHYLLYLSPEQRQPHSQLSTARPWLGSLRPMTSFVQPPDPTKGLRRHRLPQSELSNDGVVLSLGHARSPDLAQDLSHLR